MSHSPKENRAIGAEVKEGEEERKKERKWGMGWLERLTGSWKLS